MEFWMNLVLSDWMYLWLAVIVITAVIEIITVGLTSIWIAVFFVVTFILLYFTRPWAKKYLESRKVATNYEECIGKEVRVIEEVDNRKESGKVLYNGMEWTARAEDDEQIYAVDEVAVVSEIRGVKMILKRK